MAESVDSSGPDRGASKPASGCVLRLAWLLGGHAVLLCIAILIARDTQWTLTRKDIAFWCVAASVLLLRYVDVRWFDTRGVDGTPVTARDHRRFAVVCVGVWLALWIGSHCAALDG